MDEKLDQVKREIHKLILNRRKETQTYFEKILDSAKQKVLEVRDTSRAAMLEALDSGKKVKVIRNDIEKIAQENVALVKSMEKETINALTALWKEAKTAVQNLAGQDLKDEIQQFIKFLEDIMNSCIQNIQDAAQETIKYIKFTAAEIKRIEPKTTSTKP